MARARSMQSKVQQNQVLTYLLTFVLVFETVISAWCFVHFGAGTSPNIAVDRFPPLGAEVMMALTATTAAFAWFSIFRKRWAAYGLFAGLGLTLVWLWMKPLNLNGLKGPNTPESLPWWPVPSFVGITLVAALLLFVLISQEWRNFDRG